MDTVKDGFCESYFRSIEEIMPISQVDYLIVSHTEPDHARYHHLAAGQEP